MADDRDEQQREGFHWPPTSEELESIQVIEVRNDPPPAAPGRWRWPWLTDRPIIAQAGLAFASLASIGIAVTSLLAPAQPPARAAKRDIAPAPIIASSTVPIATAPAPGEPAGGAVSGSTFQHKVTFDAPPPSVAQVTAERASAGRNARTSAAGRATASTRVASLQQPLNQSSTQKPRASARGPRTSVVARQAATRETRSTVPRREAGSDPVSRFAAKTGVSVWKAMRAVGRSFKRDREADAGWSTRPTARAADGRRTAAAVNLAADDAPSVR